MYGIAVSMGSSIYAVSRIIYIKISNKENQNAILSKELEKKVSSFLRFIFR
jgi:hypothetical protein